MIIDLADAELFALAEVADLDPLRDTGQGYGDVCTYCISKSGYAEHSRPFPHRSTCPWLILRELAKRHGFTVMLRKLREAMVESERQKGRAQAEDKERAELARLKAKYET